MQGEQLTFILIIAAVAALVLIGVWYMTRRKRTEHLRDRFGDEYDRTVEEHGRGSAEKNLEAREKRVSDLRIRPLTIDERDRFAVEWRDVKALFVDSPQEAVLKGDRLLGQMMQTRGFPMADFDRRYEDLTVNHGEVARHYREGHEVAVKKNDATTEEMRRGLKSYEQLYDELVRDAGTSVEETRAATATTRPEGSGVDTDGDGHADTRVAETPAAETRVAETRVADRDGDGRADTRTVDGDGDGVADTTYVDTDGDGDADRVTTTQTANGRPVRPD